MRFAKLGRILAVAVVLLLLAAPPAWAHDQPEGGNASYVMADWMFWTFVLFGGASFVGACAAWKLGYFRDLDDQRRVPLMIDEPDYYTPEWASEDDEPGEQSLDVVEAGDGQRQQ
jgi:hypothetical protein